MKALLLALLACPSLCSASLVYAEYVITQGTPDNDPGLGNGVEIPLPPSGDGMGLQFTVPPAMVATLTPGVYHLAVRARDDAGLWCTTLSRTFFVPAAPTDPAPIDSPVDQLELFFGALDGDNDSGSGNGTPVDLGNPVNLTNINHQFSGAEIAALPPGLYRLAVRARNEAGLWSPALSRTVKLTEIPTPESFEVRYRIEGTGGSQTGELSNGPVVEFSESYAITHSLQNLPPGPYEYHAEIITGFGQVAGSASSPFELVSHVDYWDQIYFTDPSDRSDPEIAGPDADPNRDGVSNEESFILGLDPEANMLDAYGARRGRNGRGVAFATLPSALPPGASILVEGSPDLETEFIEHATISAPLDVVTATDISSSLATNPFNFAYQDLELTSDIDPSWTKRGFYQFTFDYSGAWPYPFD